MSATAPLAGVFRWLKIDEEEVGLFTWIALLLFFINVASILLNNFAETAFLKRFGVEYLPLITAINAIVTFFLFSGIGGKLATVRSDRLIASTLVGAAACSVLMRLVVPFDFTFIYPLLYILKTQFTVLLAFLFWNLANDLFSTRQSKRLFPLITSGGILGGILGSFATPLLIRVTLPDNLLLIFPLLAVLGACCSLRLGKTIPGKLIQEPATEKQKKPNMLDELRKVRPLLKASTLAQVLLLLTLLPNLVIPILNYQFSFIVDSSFTTEAAMIDFYSYFRGAQNIIALLLSLFVARLYGHFGLPVALMFHPANYLLTFTAFLFQFNIFTAIYSGVSVGVLRRTINNPATSALYGLLLPKDRAVLRPFLRGTVVRIGILAGSALLWVANPFIEPRYLSLFALGFCLLWLAATLLLKRRYSAILIALVQTSLPDFHKLGKEFKAIFKGAKLEQTLLKRLTTAQDEEARWCAEMLQRSVSTEQLDNAILEKLLQTDDKTRIQLLPYLSNQVGTKALDCFMQFIDPNNPQLMVALARTAKRIFTDMPEEQEQQFFTMAQLSEVKACFLNWMSRNHPQRFNQQIGDWLSSAQIGDRRAGVLAIGEGGSQRHIAAIEAVLEKESEPSVLALALHSLQRFSGDRRVGELSGSFLRHPDQRVRLAAIDVLPLQQDQQVNSLILTMADPTEEIRNHAIGRLEQLPPEKHRLLVAQMGTHSRWVRDGLFRIAATLDLKDIDIFNFCRGQLKIAYQSVAWSVFIADQPQTAASRLMLEHLEEVRLQRVNNAIKGVAARDSAGQIETALRGLQSVKQRERSDSIEALEVLLDKPLTNLLLPMLDNHSVSERLAVGRKHFAKAALSTAAVIDACLADSSWVTVILILECLATWNRVDSYRSQIETIAAEAGGAVAHTADNALKSTAGDQVGALSCLIDRIENIRQVKLFAELSIGQLAAVAWQAKVESYADGQLVASAERSNPGLVLIVRGAISFRQIDTSSRSSDRELQRIGSGDWFGAAAMFGMTPPEAMIARAIGDVLLLRIDRQSFHALVHQFPTLGLQVCENFSKTVGEVIQNLKSNPWEIQSVTPLDTAGTNSTAADSLVDRLFFLRRIDLFSQLETEALTAVAMVGEEQIVAAGSELKGTAVESRGLFLILAGKISIYREQSLYTRKEAGEYFGLATLFGMKAEQFTLLAETETRLLRIPPEEFRASVIEHPVIAIRACEKLSQLQGELIDILLQSDDFNLAAEPNQT